MNTVQVSAIRKRLLENTRAPQLHTSGEIDIATRATIAYSSEDPHHPIEHAIGNRQGAGSSFWAGAGVAATETIVIEFDEPQDISRLVYEVEERDLERTQEIRVEVSCDGGRSYRQLLVQQYTFSPRGATFQREDQRLNCAAVNHLRLTVVPGQIGSGRATLTSLRLFA